MKFRDPKTGNVFDCIIDAVLNFCGTKSTQQCLAHGCPIERKGLGNGGCVKWAEEHPTEAARMMGYEVIDDSSSDSSSDSSTEIDDTPTTLNDTPTVSGDTPTKEDNMEKKKPLSEWTLKEVQELCDRQDDCPGCPCYTAENGCMFSGEATSWPLSETEAMTAISATDTNVACKPARPRLAEVLGVPTGSSFDLKIGESSYGPYKLNETGNDIFHIQTESSICIEHLIYAINHPECIIRAPCLTEPEIAIMRAVGAKWVTRDDNLAAVNIWSKKPEEHNGMYEMPFSCIGSLDPRFFPSVKPGGCIELEDPE